MISSVVKYDLLTASPTQADEGLRKWRLQIIEADPSSYVEMLPKKVMESLSFLEAWYQKWFYREVTILTREQEETIYVSVASCKTRLSQFGVSSTEIETAIKENAFSNLIERVRRVYVGSISFLQDTSDLEDLIQGKKVASPVYWNTLEVPLSSGFFQDRPQSIEEKILGEDQIEVIARYWRRKRAQILGSFGENPFALTLIRETTGLSRSVMVSQKGNLYILLNRHVFCKDPVLEKRSFARTTYAVELKTRCVYISKSSISSVEISRLQSSDFLRHEAQVMQELSEIKGILKMETYSYYKNKKGEPTTRILYELSEPGSLYHFLSKTSLNLKGKELFSKSLLTTLYAIHKKGYLHRSIQLSNIFVMEDLGGVYPVFSGFSFACKKEEVDAWAGTFLYYSPEYLHAFMNSENGKHLDHEASEVWALGLVLYSIWFGKLPEGYDQVKDPKDLRNVFFKVRDKSLFAEGNKMFPWQEVISKMLFIDPKERIKLPDAIAYLEKSLPSKAVVQESSLVD